MKKVRHTDNLQFMQNSLKHSLKKGKLTYGAVVCALKFYTSVGALTRADN